MLVTHLLHHHCSRFLRANSVCVVSHRVDYVESALRDVSVHASADCYPWLRSISLRGINCDLFSVHVVLVSDNNFHGWAKFGIDSTWPYGVGSPHCARWNVDTRPSVPTNLILTVGSSQKPRNCARTMIKDSQQMICQPSHFCTKNADARTTLHPQETMTQHPHAVADYSRRSHRTATEQQDLIRQPSHFSETWVGSMDDPLRRPTPGRLNGLGHFGRSNSGNVSRTTCCTCYVRHSSTRWLGNSWCWSPWDDKRTSSRRQRELNNKKSNVANLLQAQWVRGKALPRGNAVMYDERCEICGNRWQRIPMTMVARESKTTLNNRTALASTGKGLVEIERPFCPNGHGSMMQSTPRQSLYLGMLDVQCDIRTQPGEPQKCGRERDSQWMGRDPVPLNAQEQLKCDGPGGLFTVDCTKLDNALRGRWLPLDSCREKWWKLANTWRSLSVFPKGFSIGWRKNPNRRNPFLVGCLAIERNIVALSPDRTLQPRTQCENLYMKSVETTRPLRGVAWFNEKCDFTEADAQGATVRACNSANPGIIIVRIKRAAANSHLGFYIALCAWQHERGALYILIITDSEETLSEEQFLAL